MAVETYRQLVMQLLSERAQRVAAMDEVEMQTISDPLHDHYQLAYVGWSGDRREFGCLVHVDIKGGKI